MDHFNVDQAIETLKDMLRVERQQQSGENAAAPAGESSHSMPRTASDTTPTGETGNSKSGNTNKSPYLRKCAACGMTLPHCLCYLHDFWL